MVKNSGTDHQSNTMAKENFKVGLLEVFLLKFKRVSEKSKRLPEPPPKSPKIGGFCSKVGSEVLQS
jgi:hypothetical protein